MEICRNVDCRWEYASFKRPDYFYHINGRHIIQSKGCSVWNLDGKKFDDFSAMGIGTSSLGYSKI